MPDLFPADRVAMFVGGNEVYGIGSVVKLYARHYPGMLFVAFGPGALADWLEAGGHRLHRHDGMQRFSAPRSSLAAIRMFLAKRRQAKADAAALGPVLRNHGIEVLHLHSLPHLFAGAHLRRQGFRTLFHIHNPSNPRRLAGMGLRLNHQLARRGADVLLPVSGYIAEFWRGSGVPIHVIHNAAEPVMATRPERLERPSPMPLRCLTAGRITPQKGHHLAVQAVVAAREAGHDVRLDLFGGTTPPVGPQYAEQLRTLAGPHLHDEGIRLMGLVDDLRQRHRDYHLGFQVRVDAEPCSVWVCEALVDGLPLLASATGGTPELVFDGQNGYLFPADDADALTRRLITLAEQPDQLVALANGAWRHGQTHLLPTRMVQQTSDAYRSAAQY